jgi:hypothetical protein
MGISAALAAAAAAVPTPCGDGAYETNEAEDLLFTERYPGKLCALCNLSERSTLGQGDIIKLKLSEDLDFSTLEDKRKASGGDSPGHGGISASPKSLNSRRKGRKLTWGDNSEPPADELDQVGFMDDPDLNLLFETSGKNLSFEISRQNDLETWTWSFEQKYPEKFSEFLLDFFLAKIANQ